MPIVQMSMTLAKLYMKYNGALGLLPVPVVTKSKEAFPTISHYVETWIAYVPGEAHVQGLRIKRISGTTPDFPPVLQVSLPPQNHSIIFRQYPHAKLGELKWVECP